MRSGWSEATCVPARQEPGHGPALQYAILIRTERLHLWHMEHQQGQASPHLSLQPIHVTSCYGEADAFPFYSAFLSLSPRCCCLGCTWTENKHVKDTPTKAKHVFVSEQFLSDYRLIVWVEEATVVLRKSSPARVKASLLYTRQNLTAGKGKR